MLTFGCTDEVTWTDEFDESLLYTVTVYGSQNTTYGTPHQRDSIFTYDCRDIAEDYWRYPSNYDNPFNWAYLKCNQTFPELIQVEIDKDSSDDDLLFVGDIYNINWTSNINATLLYTPSIYSFHSFVGNITFHNSTCHQVECPCYKEFGCMAYCMECEEIK